jgi:methylmalonyl-CoA mutase cobalamin-binding subunit
MKSNDINQWLENRSIQLLEELSSVPYSDDHDLKKINIIRAAMKEASVEMVKRGIDRTKKDIANRALETPHKYL